MEVISKVCPQCDMQYGYDWVKGLNFAENLARHGWQRTEDIWICPDCAERKGVKNDQT